MAVTGEPYSEARRILLADYPLPSDEEMAAADATEYDPVAYHAATAGSLPPGVLRPMGLASGAASDCYEAVIPDHFGPRKGEPGKLAVAARGHQFEGLPALVLECVEIVEGRGKVPLAWWTSFGIELNHRGWAFDPVGGDTMDWRTELTPVAGAPSAPVRARIHDGGEFVLFDGPLYVPRSWLVRTRVDPVGLLTIAGPVSGSQVPGDLDDEVVRTMLGTGNLVAAKIPVIMN
ncbi:MULTISPECIES: hypothetical protein [unclassified Amycolatopsis]|uniref:hypothetical protein n=1 Tax=unclassified Amycolatopsis TaxID=2618356 RepID=UPI0028771E90|nr:MULTISPECIES: hypothetical protein [unclassified Amycolatopsis]MDS0140606.1 hypothetical protein [Amycolatopsis sp. 505]MDS0149256.1 hypothetical protein [Amycolatopsis sp. CM201R]